MVVPVVAWYRLLGVGVTVAIIWSGSSWAARGGDEPLVVRYPDMSSPLDQRNTYFEDLLRLALDKTRDDFGDYRLQAVPLRVPQGRILRLLSAGEQVDVLWSMTTRNRERHLRPVRIPLTKGMVGYRLLVVRASDHARFADTKTVEDLARHVAGQAADWPDTDILRHNELPVTTSGYFSLFTMLQHGRIDYIPRALSEPWVEVAQRSELDLKVEPTLLLYYPAASYFFVRRQNTALAQRLEQGLERAIADGSFDELFYQHPSHRPVFKRGELSDRRVLRLTNPLLPESVPLNRPELWWRPETLSATEIDRDDSEVSEP
ncbi:transporter substrate-binding domain-containing protein [Marinimicrobium sp. C6131]|uniref:substrate-binding periplasmic protein n=1 Tax=Marinimicrobium sp. C6131 TaxID=3022676 RepID=UPI00223CE134|nr:transporter substrate-binding domain-containing protein [Marinimicrobium sp. C6131]UZJ45648.1 transporter substrate-binding domain-containing protein [Marinimicrobium sp. C6131]